MKNTIVFLINIDNQEGYSALANFINKRENHRNLTNSELKNVTYKYYLNNEIETKREWAKVLAKAGNSFLRVQYPERIKNITDQYEVIYCINIAEGEDIASLYNLYLISHYYKKLQIIVLFNEHSDKYYFEVSQFLYHVNRADPKFLDSCYFVKKDVRKPQMENVKFSRDFIPLQIVDRDHINGLFQSSGEFLDEAYVREILTQKKAGSLKRTKNELLEGAVKLLHDVQGELVKVPPKRIVEWIGKTDIFSFILLCYVLAANKDSFRFETLEAYVYEMQQYATAIRQLAENIVFHSETGFGVIAFRVHKGNSDYMKRQYHIQEEKQRCNFLEIIVGDFCGGSGTKNIAENFLQKVGDPLLKEKFSELCPESFFMHVEEEGSAWEQFYRNPDNIGKHFGLRIFQSVVRTFGGLFGAESHSGYLRQQGDDYLSYAGNPAPSCMPGTKYHIVFPVGQAQAGTKKQDLSLDTGIGISANIDKILEYSTGILFVRCDHQEFLSQEQKNQRIQELSIELQKGMGTEKVILYASMENVGEGMGEILTKALIMALFRMKRNVYVVLYQCSENMKKSIFDTIKVFFDSADMEGMFYGVTCQLILYSKDYEETVVDLGSVGNTDSINAYISHTKCIRLDKWLIGRDQSAVDLNKGAEKYIPCEVLQEVEMNGKSQTLFEHYTEMILERNIQDQDFGCKFEHTHMRLGSTIHIENFYEAEILFGNKLFVSRFALLLFQDMRESTDDVEKLTLYGYGTYSETVLVQMRDMILSYYKSKGGKDVDYIILEREEERRGFLHKDRIRYNRSFSSDEERKEYFRDRKLAIVVLINSTLKTHARLISMFRNENGKGEDDTWLIKNYAAILVGNMRDNKYWKPEGHREIQLKEENGTKIIPTPRYFIQLEADYKEPMDCDCCFPENPLAELPLIEVNAASTIPNQAYGIVKHEEFEGQPINADWIKNVEDELKCLHSNFIYGHVQRNENHFLYYFRTENIWINEKNQIEKSLREWETGHYNRETERYNIIVAPMHYSNAGFVELVNNIVFGGNAILVRLDFDKEYRCNAYTKFSYLRNYVEQLSSMENAGVLNVHFVDDSIISGRTFYRAKSLMESILKVDQGAENALEIRIFDKVFVLIDRNSGSSRAQYVKSQEKNYYSFLHIDISSLRNHGDSCVFCNLKKEADLLKETASTASVAEYWDHCIKKFRLRTLEEYDEEKKQKSSEAKKKNSLPEADAAYLRLFCTNMAQRVLTDENHGNDRAETIYRILRLITTDYDFRRSAENEPIKYKKLEFEYFMSYLKCISRPFLVFKRSVKEAIFDILLIIIDAVVRSMEIRKVIREVENKKPYLKNQRLIREFNRLDRDILCDPARTERDRQDLVKLLMKQLTELKSNYIIRPEKMTAIFQFMGNVDSEKFELYYLTLICRLVGASSDTNKSIWMEEHIGACRVPEKFKTWVRLENTRTLRDGLEKFYIKFKSSEEFQELSQKRLSVLREYNELRIAERMFSDYIKRNKAELSDYENREENGQETIQNVNNSIRRFLRSLPAMEEIDFYDDAVGCVRDGYDWKATLHMEQKKLKRKMDCVKRRHGLEAEGETGLQAIINGELNIYQYNNFCKILKEENYIGDSEKITQDGADMVICSMRVMELCRSSESPILSKVEELVMLFKVILGAEKVQFIVENKAENALDEWKKEIEERFNRLVEEREGQEKELKLHLKPGRHYAVIREQAETGVYEQDLSGEIEEMLEKMEHGGDESHNYIIDRDSGIVIWKLANRARSIWVSMKSIAWQGNDDGKTERDLRKVMLFYQELREKIFSPENDDYMNEISNARKKLNIYNSNRVYTHTKENLQREQYERVYRYYTKGDQNNAENDKNNTGNASKFEECYPAYVLKLLSDITVSKYYRRGLRKMRAEVELKQFARWSEFSEFFGDKKEFFYRMDGDNRLFVELETEEIGDEQEILCGKDDRNSIRELTLLIYALVLNAAEKNRGKREINENSTIQKREERVIVRLKKEKQYLVIQNECAELADIDQIRQKLNQVPESEEDGISLWSMNCYIKSCINNLITAMLKRVESDNSEILTDVDLLLEIKRWIEELVGENFTVQPESDSKDGKNYFAVKIPLFMKNYHCSAAEKERGEQHD